MIQINLITLESCGACHVFMDEEWKGEEGLDVILRDKGFSVVHYNIKNSNKAQWRKDNPKLAACAGFFPQLIATNSKTGDVISVFAANKVNHGYKYDGETAIDKKNVLNWTLSLSDN